jgi:hypothetical protein
MSYETCIDRLTVYFSSAKYQREVVKAKEQFFADIGINEKDTGDFERNLNLFFDWYLFTRPLQGTLLTPAKMALNLDGFEITAEERPFFEALAEAKYCLFEYLKSKGNDHYAKNIVTNDKVVVKNSNVNMLMTPKGSIFSTHFAKDGGTNFFTSGIICHPVDSKKFIVSEAKKLKGTTTEQQSQVIIHLIKLYFKLERYPHVNQEQIYSNNSSVRF